MNGQSSHQPPWSMASMASMASAPSAGFRLNVWFQDVPSLASFIQPDSTHNEGPATEIIWNHQFFGHEFMGTEETRLVVDCGLFIFAVIHIQVIPSASVSKKDRTFRKNLWVMLTSFLYIVLSFSRSLYYVDVYMISLQIWIRSIQISPVLLVIQRWSIGHIQLHTEVLLRNLQSPSNSGASNQQVGWYPQLVNDMIMSILYQYYY